MSLEVINTGTAANSGDGDNLRAAMTKAKNNFAEIYADDFVTSARIADDVALGGNPTTTTQTAGDNSTKIATTAYADTAVANAIDAAPAALDTLNELAASLNDDADFAGTMTTSLAGKLSTDAGAVGTSNLADDAVTADKLANSINTEIAANTAKVTNATHTGDVTGATALTIAADAVDGTKIADDSIDSEHFVDGSIDTAHIADDAVTADKLANSINTEIAANTAKTGISSEQASAITANTAKVTNATHTGDVTGSGALTIADDAVTIAKIADAAIVTEAEGIGSNDNDTTLPTSAAVVDYVANNSSDSLAALTATDGGFVVGDGTNFGVETGSTARDSIGLGTSGHIQFHCLGVGEAASTNNGQIDATTVYADTFGKDSGDYITWTTDTQMDFYVNGSNEMRLEADGDLHVDGDVIAASATVSSDEKLKENIKPIFAPLETLDQIKGVDFNWKKDGSKSSGVIAQDIQKVMPHLVKEVKSLDSDDSHLTVDYNGLIGLLIESVKTLQAEVETLKNK
jgi:hypothetical protein